MTIVRITEPYFHAVAEAHVALDPTAFLSKTREIGVHFREKIFYPCLYADPDSFVWIALVEGHLAGYVVGTKNVKKFYHRLKRFNPLLLAILFARGALLEPRKALEYMLNLRSLEKSLAFVAIEAEVISFGVLPQFRSAEFERTRGVHIATELFSQALSSFMKMGAEQFKVMTIQENRLSNRFYEKWGMQLAGKIFPWGSACNLYVGKTSQLPVEQSP